MAIGDIGSSIEVYEFQDTYGRHPFIEEVKEGQFCVGYTDPDNHGACKSFDITAAGDISEPASNHLVYTTLAHAFNDACLRPDNNIVFVFQGPGGSLNFECVRVAADGTIDQNAAHHVATEANGCSEFNIVHQRGNVVACCHDHPAGVAYVTTVGVSTVGAVSDPRLDRFELTPVINTYPQCVRVNDGVVLAVWRHNDNKIWARTVNVAADGTMTATAQAAVKVGDISAIRPSIQMLTDSWAIVAVEESGQDCFLIAFQVDAAGIITIPANNTHQVNTGKGIKPKLVVLDDDVVCIAGHTSGNVEELSTVQVTTADPVVWSNLDAKSFTGLNRQPWNILLSSYSVVAISFFDGSDHGKIETHEVESGGLVLGEHELILGIGP